MARGGYQKPSSPAAVSGPGKFSKRTDGQAAVSDGLDNPDVQYGDKGMLERGQAVAPARGAAGGLAPGGGAERRMTGEPPTRGKLPSFLWSSEDTAPGEPTTAGVDIGAGPGHEVLDAATPAPDVRETVLEFLVQTYGNEDVAQMLNEMRNQRETRVSTSAMAAPVPMADGLPTGEPAPIPTA